MIITIGAEKGGVGKTRLSTHTAALAAAEGIDVALLDTDLQGSAISWSRIRNAAGITPQIPVFSLPEKPLQELISLSSKYDLIVVDIGAQNYKTMLECALVSDLVLVPCGDDQQEIESALKVFDDLKNKNSKVLNGKIPAHIVLTRVSPVENSKLTQDLRTMFAEEGISVFDAHLAYRTSWKATGRTGRAVHELKGKERSQKAVDEMAAVFKEVFKRVKAAGKGKK